MCGTLRRFLPATVLAWGGVDGKALETLVGRAREAKSDALVVLCDGEVACEEYFDRPPPEPIELMSCTKSVVSLLVGILVDDGAIGSLDLPVSTWFPQRPEWKQAPRSLITLRHLLGHASGIATDRTTEKIYASADFVRFALDAPVDGPPGARFLYNNAACNLICGVIEQASGEKADDFARERLFDPLGIPEFGWTRDRAGNPHGMAGLQLAALDFARVGQLVLDGGEWEGERIVSEEWLAASMEPPFPQLGDGAARCGLLWWLEREAGAFGWDDALLARWKEAGGSERLLAVGAELRGKRCAGLDATRAELRSALARVAQRGGAYAEPGWFDPEVNRLGVPFWNEEPGPVVAWRADGYLGNYLVIVPGARIVAVRQRRYPRDEKELNDPRYGMQDFAQLVLALQPARPAQESKR